MPVCTMLHVATKKEEGHIFKEYQPKMVSKRLAVGLRKLHDENDPKDLFYYVTGYLLNQISTKVGM